MSTVKAAWGIEIGAHGIKAIRLERDGERVSVSDFAVIPHKKVLTTPDLDQDEMVRLSLGQFISQKTLEGEHLVMSVPGHAAFARFAKLPPVEPKKVPDIVKFEAVQQIPFPIDEVEWDYQTFSSDDSPEIEVGIFAITRDRVKQRLGLYAELGVSPEALTLSPVALYNSMAYDLGLSSGTKPIVILDIGTQATDVVIADENRCWIRTFPLGGTHFTEAIANAFKLSYSKAEKLKKEASTSKYAKQIMQAMRPVFSDLLQDLQRSIGYYQSLHREHDLETMLGVGSTFKIPGLRKFIGQQLQINVVRLDEYKKIAVTGREAAAFAENAVNMATAYGLALQGVDLAPIAANLVPVKALREQMWHQKTKWFAAAAAIIVVGAATTLYHPFKDRSQLKAKPSGEVATVLARGKQLREDFTELRSQADVGFTAENMRRLVDYRSVWPSLIRDASAALASTNPQPALLEAKVEEIVKIDPARRRLVQLDHLDGEYIPPADAKQGRRIAVRLDVTLTHDDPVEFLNRHVASWLRENAEPAGDRADVPYRIIADTISCNPEELDTVRADDAGIVKDDRDGRRGERGRSSQSGGRSGGGRGGAAPGGGGLGAGGAGLGAGAGGGSKRAKKSRKAAPGTLGGFGGLAGFPGGARGSGGTPSGRATGAGGSSGGGRGGPMEPLPPAGSTTGEPPRLSPQELNDLAPMPEAPAVYPALAPIHRVPITFDVELIDPNAPKTTADQTASAAKQEADG